MEQFTEPLEKNQQQVFVVFFVKCHISHIRLL